MLNAFQGQEHQPFTLQASGEKAVLLIHGFPGSAAEMRPIGEVLHAQGMTARGVLLPGFGHAIETLPQKKHSDWLECVLLELEQLRRDYRHIVLIGNSMGGALSIQVASRIPIDKLILFAPFYKVNSILWEALPLIQFALPTFKPFRVFKPDFNDPEFQLGFKNFMPEADLQDPIIQQGILDFAVDTRVFGQIRLAGLEGYRLAPHVTAPTLVIQGDQDELVTPQRTRELTNRLNGSVEWLEVSATHNPLRPTEAYWQTIVQRILDFIDS
ncbi:MAG: alpha/beta hydrolase [Phototrophicaceae bacterium]